MRFGRILRRFCFTIFFFLVFYFATLVDPHLDWRGFLARSFFVSALSPMFFVDATTVPRSHLELAPLLGFWPPRAYHLPRCLCALCDVFSRSEPSPVLA